MSTTPELWQRTIAGKKIGAWHVTIKGRRINLRTKDFDAAKKRRREAMSGHRSFREDASMRPVRAAVAKFAGVNTDEGAAGSDSVAALAGAPPPDSGGGSVTPPAEAPNGQTQGSVGPPPPEVVQAEPIPAAPSASGWADDVQAAAGAPDPLSSAPTPEPAQVSDEQLAKLAVDFEIWGAEYYAKQAVYPAFVAPIIPDEGKAKLAEPFVTLFRYLGAGAVLPPWVTGGLLPAVSIVVGAVSLGQAFAAMAAEQKRAAGAAAPGIASTGAAAA